MKPAKTIREIIVEMCLYWNIPAAHELKTRNGFKKMGVSLDGALCSVTPGQLVQLYHTIRAKSKGTDESVKRHYDYVKRVFTYAHGLGYIKVNPCVMVKLPRTRKAPIVALTALQVEHLEQLKLSGRLQMVRDWFLFQCYTGLAFTDFALFGRHSVKTVMGRVYVHGYRQKTNTEYFLPLSEKARQLCELYNYNFDCRCVQVYNRELKKLQKVANFDTRLTTHVARRTFGQLHVDNGVPLETVSRMLGHSSTAMTESKYARVGMVRVMRDMCEAA